MLTQARPTTRQRSTCCLPPPLPPSAPSGSPSVLFSTDSAAAAHQEVAVSQLVGGELNQPRRRGRRAQPQLLHQRPRRRRPAEQERLPPACDGGGRAARPVASSHRCVHAAVIVTVVIVPPPRGRAAWQRRPLRCRGAEVVVCGAAGACRWGAMARVVHEVRGTRRLLVQGLLCVPGAPTPGGTPLCVLVGLGWQGEEEWQKHPRELRLRDATLTVAVPARQRAAAALDAVRGGAPLDKPSVGG